MTKTEPPGCSHGFGTQTGAMKGLKEKSKLGPKTEWGWEWREEGCCPAISCSPEVATRVTR